MNTPPTRILHVGQGGDFSATALPENANNRTLRWTSSKPEVASVEYLTGEVTAKAVGETNIIATAQDGSGKYGVCVLTVEPPIAVQGIDICLDNYTMNVGDTTYLSYDIYPSDATNQNVTWYSTNPSVASVDATTGHIQALGIGNAVIQVSDDNGHTSECNIEVKPVMKIFETEKTVFGEVINDVMGAQAYRITLNMTYHITKVENGKAYVSEISAFTKYDKGNTAVGLQYPDITIGRLQIGSDTYAMESDDREFLVSPSWKWNAKVIYLNKWYDIGTRISLLSIIMLDASSFPYRDVELETSLIIS